MDENENLTVRRSEIRELEGGACWVLVTSWLNLQRYAPGYPAMVA